MPAADPYKLAWEARREANRDKVPVDNASLQAGSPCYFRCPSCYGDIIVTETYLTKPKLCYDCLELVSRGLLRNHPHPGGWQWTGK
ncbi:MAG TPA: hypothetical protein VKD72_10305 [Gemmataceae bacterium]|nr:hypothetical protein [Gemmataceae bacterium]